MLQQIITEYSGQNHTTSGEIDTTTDYKPTKYEGLLNSPIYFT